MTVEDLMKGIAGMPLSQEELEILRALAKRDQAEIDAVFSIASDYVAGKRFAVRFAQTLALIGGIIGGSTALYHAASWLQTGAK